MKFRVTTGLIIQALLLPGFAVSADKVRLDTITFGSCLKETKAVPILASVMRMQPDLFIFMGDNIYADTEDIGVMRQKYAALGAKREFQYLRENTQVLATWDDHDFGSNDIGRENPIALQSKNIFLDFWSVPKRIPVRHREGIYQAKRYDFDGRIVQVILLDTRSFRGPLIKSSPTAECKRGRYLPQTDYRVPLLGEDQWAWFENQLWQPADLRIIVSSIQVIPDEHCYEKWSNLPHERARLFEVIERSQAEGIIFISGDRHIGEISKIEVSAVPYALYEVTSSSLNYFYPKQTEPNHYRLHADNIRANNFGMIKIDWQPIDPLISLQLRGKEGELLREIQFTLSHISVN